jgi:hypothetical protein
MFSSAPDRGSPSAGEAGGPRRSYGGDVSKTRAAQGVLIGLETGASVRTASVSPTVIHFGRSDEGMSPLDQIGSTVYRCCAHSR